MAQRRYGLLVDHTLRGRTIGLGVLAMDDKGASVPWGGVLAAGGYSGPPVPITQSSGINGGVLGATLIFETTEPTIVSLPPLEPGINLRFIVGDAPAGGMHVIAVDPANPSSIHGGVQIANAVPGAVLARRDSRLSISSAAVPGDRISFASGRDRWYVSEGLFANDGSASFS